MIFLALFLFNIKNNEKKKKLLCFGLEPGIGTSPFHDMVVCIKSNFYQF